MALLKLPVPDEDHVEEVALPPIVPAKMCVLPAQISASTPAFTVADAFTESTMASLVAGHVPTGSFVVIVSVTVPAITSGAEGVYPAVSKVASSNVPVPDVVHKDDVALPPLVPDNVCVFPEQIFASDPALTVAAWFIVKTITSFTAGHGPTGLFVVIVKLTEPAVMSAADGV